MISNEPFSVESAVLVWVIGASFYVLAFQAHIVDNQELQSTIILALGILPSAWNQTRY